MRAPKQTKESSHLLDPLGNIALNPDLPPTAAQLMALCCVSQSRIFREDHPAFGHAELLDQQTMRHDGLFV